MQSQSRKTDLWRSLTILTPTSPIPCHPSVDLIQRAIASLGVFAGLAGCRHLIVCDGDGCDSPEATARYADYRRNLRMLAAAKLFCTDVTIHELPARVGLPGVILASTKLVKTPFIFVYEHDWEIVRRIDTRGILQTLASHPGVKHIRLNKRPNIEAGLDCVLKPDNRRRPTQLVRTSAWSANPHFSKISYYRRRIVPLISPRPEGGAQGFEEPCFTRLFKDIRALGFDRAHRQWGCISTAV